MPFGNPEIKTAAVPAVEPVDAVLDEDGEIVTPAVHARAAQPTLYQADEGGRRPMCYTLESLSTKIAGLTTKVANALAAIPPQPEPDEDGRIDEEANAAYAQAANYHADRAARLAEFEALKAASEAL